MPMRKPDGRRKVRKADDCPEKAKGKRLSGRARDDSPGKARDDSPDKAGNSVVMIILYRRIFE